MGEVYRAHDTRLNRDVALKILPDSFVTDPDRLARFEREAQILASLNHPHIATLYGLEDSTGTMALVLELVEGPTLADRIAEGRVPVDEALSIAGQIAEALSAAHEHGIVHRDLKPANIKLRSDGTVKVLDFGLAKALDPEPGPTLSRNPTVTSPALTRAGVVLGTAAYMAPEQATGKTADTRVDIWAFGVTVYEMLTGRRTFDGETNVEVLSNVLKTQPEWSALPTETPAGIRVLLRRCLQKEPTRRLRDIADARFSIEDARNEAAHPAADTGLPISHRRERLLWASTLVLTVAAAALALWMWRPAVVENGLRLEITTPPTTDPTSMAISPDGRTLVFMAELKGVPQLWVRSLDATSLRTLAGTENAARPFWSPDSRSIGFFANGRLKRVDVSSGSVQELGQAAAAGGSWNQDDTILFSPGPGAPLVTISANGGHRNELTGTLTSGSVQTFPQFMPDGRRFLFSVTGQAPGVYVASLDVKEPPRRILDAAYARYVDGHLLFVSRNTLFVQAFDANTLTLGGRPTSVADGIVAGEDVDGAALSASTNGPIVYRTGVSGGLHEFVWFDRAGNAIETVPGSAIGSGFHSSLSPDGTQLAISRNVGGSPADIWILDVRRGVSSRFTSDPSFDLTPVWSPDGSRIAFASFRLGTPDVFVKSRSGPGVETLLEGGDAGPPSDWSRDGRFLLRARQNVPPKPDDIWAVAVDGDRKAFPVADSEFHESNGQFSPDGNWVAYQSNSTGQPEIYVQPFPGPGQKVQVSAGGGVQARWRQDGRELFYLSLDNRIMATPIRLEAARGTVDPGTPKALFAIRPPNAPQQAYARQYSVSRDGTRFLVDTLKESALPVVVAFNWRPKP